MKKFLYLAALSIAAAVMLVGLSGCPQKPKGDTRGTFKVDKLSFGNRKVDLEKLESIPDAAVKEIDFVLEADAPISSVSVEYDGNSFSGQAVGSSKKFIGRLESLPIGRQVIAAFTVNSDGKKPVLFSFAITFSPDAVSFSKIYVDDGKANSKVDFSAPDGACVILSKDTSAVLTIESLMELETCTVSVESGAAADATKVSPNKFTYNLSGLSDTAETKVTVNATVPFKKPSSFSFKVKKGKLYVGIKSIKVDGRDVSVFKALSAEGALVEFDDTNALIKGAAKIEVELEEAYTSLTKSAEPGFVAASFKENSSKTSFSASAVVISDVQGSPQNPEVVPKDNVVSFGLKATNREDSNIKLVLKNTIKELPPVETGLLNGDSLYYYPNFVMDTLPPGIPEFKSYGKYASVFMAKKGTDGLAAYTKRADNDDWTYNNQFEVLSGAYSVFKQLIIGTFNGMEGKFKTIIAPPDDKTKHAAVMITVPVKKVADYGFSALFFDKQGQRPDGSPAAWQLIFEPSASDVTEIIGMSGKTYKIKKADFNDKVGYFQFTWRTPGVKITSAKFKKSSSVFADFTSETVIKEDNKCTVLCERGFYDFELGVGQGSTPINYEIGKYYKYELKLMIEGETMEKTLTIILHCES